MSASVIDFSSNPAAFKYAPIARSCAGDARLRRVSGFDARGAMTTGQTLARKRASFASATGARDTKFASETMAIAGAVIAVALGLRAVKKS